MAIIREFILKAPTAVESTTATEFDATYVVIVDSKEDDAVSIRAQTTIIPARGDSYQYGGSSHHAHVSQVTYEREMQGTDEQGWKWVVKVHWTTAGETIENPLNRPARYELIGTNEQQILLFDRDGVIVANTAGQLFDPPVLHDVATWTLVIVQNVPSFDMSLADEIANCINEFDYFGAPAGTLKIGPPRAVEVEDPVYGKYIERTLTIDFKRDGWQPKVVDMGTQERFGSEVRAITTDPAKDPIIPVSEPVYLDGAGKKGSSPVELEFEAYREINFGTLGI